MTVSDPLLSDQFVAFRDLIEERCGLHFDESQRGSLSVSVKARMQQLGLVDVGDYYERLRGQAVRLVEAELRNLLSMVTVTETCFFRDPPQFRLLRAHILPTLIAEHAGRGIKRTLRIWSAGCSTGEEAYSIALAMWDQGVYLAYPDWTFEIVGTDVNSKALEKARSGVYSGRAVRNVEGHLLRQYFRREGNQFCLAEKIKQCVRFEYGNLTQTPMPSTGPQDIVFCKNVTIYFQPDVTRRLMRGLRDTLSDGGYLLLGHAESLWQMSDGFTLVEHDRAFAYRKTARRPKLPKLEPAPHGKTPVVPTAKAVVPAFRSAHSAAVISAPPAPGAYEGCLASFRAGDWAGAESSLAGLIQDCPTFAPAHLLLGGVYAHRGRYDEAAEQAELVLRLTEFEPRAHLLLGMIAARQQRGDDALRLLRRALYLDASLALAHFWLGNLYRDRGDLARACHEYQNVVQDWKRHTFELTEEFASELSAEQLVEFCSDSLQRLQGVQEMRPNG